MDYSKMQEKMLNDLVHGHVGDLTPIGGLPPFRGTTGNSTEYSRTITVPSSQNNSLKQNFSEADGDIDGEQLFPELYKIFNSKIAELSNYVGLTENPYDFQDETYRLKLFGQLSYAMRKSSEALAWAFVQQKMAYARRREAEAIAALDDFPQYISEQSDLGVTIKATDATRESFVKRSPRVINAHLREGTVDAMAEQLAVLKVAFSEGSKTLRSMVYGQKDSNNLSSLNNT